ncbi:MAG: hypothetical protein AAF938_00045 [Myxococcota bacterium]
MRDAVKEGPPLRSDSGPRIPRAAWIVGGFLTLALIEVVGASTIRNRVPPETDWEQAARHVDGVWQDGDLAIVAPSWADPVLRQHMGARISVQDAGRADLAPYERVWEFSLGGHVADEVRGLEPTEVHRVGRITVRRYDLGPSNVLYDLTSNILEAKVSAGERECRLRRLPPEGGGLFAGPMRPEAHFFCGPEPWLWVGPTVSEDLSLRNRYCVWQHPRVGDAPTTATFEDVPLGESVVLNAGLYYAHERPLEHGPFTVQVLVGDDEVGRLVHRDGDGFERIDALTPGRTGTRGDVSIVVTAPDNNMRTVCWAASVRGAER